MGRSATGERYSFILQKFHFSTVSVILPVILIHHRLDTSLTVKIRGECWEVLVEITLPQMLTTLDTEVHSHDLYSPKR